MEEAIGLGLERGGFMLPKKDGEPGAAAGTAASDAAAPPAPAPGEPAAAAAAPEPESLDADIPEPSEAEMAGAPQKLKMHMRRVHQQNTRLKDQVRTLAPGSQQFEKLQSFMASNELDARSAATALRIAAQVQGALNGRVDPATVMGELAQWTDQLRLLAGDALPADVQQRLDDGVIDEATAKEIAHYRAQQVTTTRRAELDTAALSTQAVSAHATLVRSAVQTWEQAIRARDPDYPRKAQLVEARAFQLRTQQYGAQGMPPTPEEAMALAQRAYDDVSKQMQPPRASVRAPLTGAASPKSTVRTPPKTMLEAVQQGLERMGT